MSKQLGFTLVELMVVVAIIVILATIAYPMYSEQARKGRRVEGRDALLAIAQAEERFYTVNGTYVITDINDLGVGAACNRTSQFGCTSQDRGYYNVTVSGTASTFSATATATGGQASDTCTAMTIDQLGQKGGTGTGCW